MQRPLPLVLRHIDASRNMARFYMLSIEPNLLGTVSLVRQWGRIGSMGQCKIELFDRYEEAIAAFEHLGIAKRRKGYCICT